VSRAIQRLGWAGGLAGPGPSQPRRPGQLQCPHCGKAGPSVRQLVCVTSVKRDTQATIAEARLWLVGINMHTAIIVNVIAARAV